MILRPGTFLQDRYEILEQIGSGGMSDVYKALCHKLNRPVAIKVLKEEFSLDSGFVGKFKMEAQAAARLSHPNIVNVYDVVDEGNLHYIVMELIEGVTLKNYILKKGCLDIKEAIGIAIQVAQGIAAAHERGIIHRDIKPQNIIIARDGKVKVADFGIARAASSQTLNAIAMGSVHYISPEQARGGYSDMRSDVYSLGITIYEMVAGCVPFDGDNTVTVALAHLEEPITPPSYYNPQIPISLENIILKCTEKKPEYRYGTMLEVISDLRKSLITPDDDFVQSSSDVVNQSQTVIISPPEMEQIRKARKKTVESEQKPYRNSRSSDNSVRKRKQEPEPDINPKIEKLLTAAGVIVAVIIVAVVVVVFSRLGGLFNSGSGKTAESTTIAATEKKLGEKQVYMPTVLGLTNDIAKQKLKENGGLDMKVSGYAFSDTVEIDDVISQKPEANEIVDKYSAVTVVLSKGPENPQVDLTKMGIDSLDENAVKTLLEDKGLVVVIEKQNSATIESGKLINYKPDKAKKGETITVVFSTGPEIVNRISVPNLVSQPEAIAAEMLADAGLIQGQITQEASETILAGNIIRQTVEAGTQVSAGTAISYVVSSGSAEQAKYKYLASIDKSYPLQNIIGPGSATTQVTIKIQLKQTVNGKTETRDLLEPFTINGDQILPVSFKNIEGAYGVTSGEVEIVNVTTGDVINAYPVTFIPIPQS